jgi:hypothetical protein
MEKKTRDLKYKNQKKDLKRPFKTGLLDKNNNEKKKFLVC